MRELMVVLKALADENRVRIVAALGQGELCVCQIVELLGLAPSTVSKHVSILKHARLVDARKTGRWVFCRLADCDAPPLAREIYTLIRKLLSDDPQARRDEQRLKEIRSIDPEQLCRKHHRRS
jgi:DNA-binding transcriptional ArsR family regulator